MKKKLSLLCNLFVAIMTLAAWCIAAFRVNPDALLVSRGLENLKYFTVLSNLLNGAVSLVYAIALLRLLRAGSGEIARPLQCLKLAAAAAVGLTFLVIALFLGPLYGHRYMYSGSNLWYHLVLPLVSMLELCLLDREPVLPFRDTLWAGLPALLYGCGYTLNLLLNGIGVWPDTNDFYGFVNWGWGVGFLIFGSIVLASWLLAVLLRALSLLGTARAMRAEMQP